jgi:hypothetical protein
LEQRLSEQRASLKVKLPEMERALAVVKQLRQKNNAEDTRMHFELSTHVYAEGTVKAGTNTVFLWLGVRVLLNILAAVAINFCLGQCYGGISS